MSLCQSLRQYVFVHGAIIEGSLKIADEERERRRQSPPDGNTYVPTGHSELYLTSAIGSGTFGQARGACQDT